MNCPPQCDALPRCNPWLKPDAGDSPFVNFAIIPAQFPAQFPAENARTRCGTLCGTRNRFGVAGNRDAGKIALVMTLGFERLEF